MLLSLTMTVSLLSGCGAKNDGGKETGAVSNSKYENFITVDVFNNQANYQGIQSGWFGKVVKDKFNMELNIIAPNVAGGGDTLFQTRSAAGDLGDLIITGAQDGKLQNLVTAGLLMDMSELMKTRTNVNQYDTAIKATNSLVKEEGVWAIPNEISSLPADTPSEGLDLTYGPYLRWDAYKAAGYPQMSTVDDLLPTLKKMQELVPESSTGKKTYAFSFFKDWDGNMMNNAKPAANFYGYDELGFVLAKADGSDYQSLIQDDSFYIQALKLYFDANQMGLVDPESTTQNYDTLFTKYKDGSVLYSPWPWLGQSAYNTSENKAKGEGFMLAPIDDIKIFSYGCSVNGNPKNAISIGNKAEDPERLADFIDWLYSPEGICYSAQQTASTSGPENLTWEMKDERPVLTDFGKQAMQDGDATMPEEWGGGSWKEGVSQLNFKAVSLLDINPDSGFPYTYTLWDSVLEENKTPLDVDWQEKMNAKTTLDYLQQHDQVLVAPGSDYVAPQEASDIIALRNQCKSTIVENSWKMIFAKDEAEFNTLLKQMQETAVGLGYEDVLAVDMQNAKDQDSARKAILQASTAK